MGEIQQIAREVFRSGEACLCLESLDLQELPPEIFADGTRNFSSVTTLKLDYNDLTFLPSEINALTGLKELSAIGNGLNRLPDSIGQLTNLEGVLLNDNNLTHLPATLAALRKLRVLNLVGNELQTWNEEFSAAFSESITHLHLDENKLSSLPESFGSMSKLRVLELGDNSIPSLPETFGNLQELEILNLSRNKLTELPRSFADLPNLVALDLTANKLENLPDTFKSSRKLQRLFLDKNSVKLLPAWFEQLEKITEIGLADNLLHGDSLSSGFGSASGSTLKILDLAGNSITTLPETLGNLKALESLHLGSTIPELERRGFQNGNSLSKLPENFGGMSNLRKLRLDENKLYELPESFGHLENLEWLELGQNLLTELPESFCCLTQLSYAQLSRNQLKSLPQNFGNLTSLIDLRLDNNNLTDIPDSFANLKDLQTLDLFHNKLSTIPKVLLQLQKLIRLDLDGNNLKIKSDKVPKLTAQIKYPERDSNLKDNWRGRTRQDYIPLSGDDTVEVLRDVEEEEDDRLDAEDTEEELSYNESALIRAMRRGLSIWKSHDGPQQREQANPDAVPQEKTMPIYSKPLPTVDNESLYMNAAQQIFEDADEVSTTVSAVAVMEGGPEKDLNLDESEKWEAHEGEDHQDGPVDEEDWEEEIQEAQAYEHVLKRLKQPHRVQGAFTNKLQDFLVQYPPAAQAVSPMAVYQSVAFTPPFQPMQWPGITEMVDGQFDDAAGQGDQ